MKGDEHLALLGIANTLDCPNQACTLWHQELLVVVRVVVGGEHDKDRSAQSAVNVVGDDAFQHCSFEHPKQAPLVLIEVIGEHRVRLRRRFRLCSASDIQVRRGNGILCFCCFGSLLA